MWYWLLALLCVAGISVGQVLFKSSAAAFSAAGTLWVWKPMIVLGIALFLYAVTTIGWVFVLSKLSLVKAYPLMALAFVFVPILSYFIFHDAISVRYAIGVVCIVIGVALSVTA